MTHSELHTVLDPRPGIRRRAVEALGDSEGEVYLLRSAMLLDRDATVRERAARQLARLAVARRRAGATIPDAWRMWFEDACRDSRPSVRQAGFRGLARVRHPASAEHLRAACLGEPDWTVRRAAIVALATSLAADATATLLCVLDDPFWRVRHTAARILSALGNAHDEVRQAVLAASTPDSTDDRTEWAQAALAHIRRTWLEQPGSVLQPAPRPEPVRLADARIDPVWDPDPAVMSARLEDPAAQPSRALLITAIADSHEALRKQAVARLRAAGDTRALIAAMAWLDEPRIPHASAAVRSILDSLGDGARALAGQILEADDSHFGPGARVWALSWIGATGCTELRAHALRWSSSDHPDTRAAAATAIGRLAASVHVTSAEADSPLGRYPAAAVAILGALLGDRVLRVRDAAALALSGLHHRDAVAALSSLQPSTRSALTQRALVHVALRTGDDVWQQALLDALFPDGDAGAIAHLLSALSGARALSADHRTCARGHADPWLRAAVLDDESARAALTDERDPQMRRAACAHLAESLPLKQRGGLGLRLHGDRDPWLRTRAALLLDGAYPAQLCALLRLSADSTLAVRSAAAERLHACAHLDQYLSTLLASDDPAASDDRVRISAYTWLARAFDETAGRALTEALSTGRESPAVKAHIISVLVSLPEAARRADIALPTRTETPVARARARASRLRAVVAHRPLTNTGIDIAPLIVSGAHELSPDSLRDAHDAGVDTFFWEPHHRALSAFLRRPPAERLALRIITGSFHGSPRAVEADVERALRRLRTDYLDVFLLFWVRSRARLNDRVQATMRQLVQRGKIRAIGFSTHDRTIATEAIASGGWDVVMTRHNAAHTGAETSVFPAAQAAGASALTFSALCYGQMLRQPPRSAAQTRPPSAADCYRYSLSQPGVTGCITAPRRHAELVHNLQVLAQPTLSPERERALRDHGRTVYARNKDFNALIRREPRPDWLARERLLGAIEGLDSDHAHATRSDSDAGEVAPKRHF